MICDKLYMLTQPKFISQQTAFIRQALFICVLFTMTLTAKSQNTAPYRNSSYGDVGAIAFDPNLDDPNFKLCDEQHISQNYQVNPVYPTGTEAMQNYLRTAFNTHIISRKISAIITIRFLINCKGETGRFRAFQVDTSYKPVELPPEISHYLLASVRKLGNWLPGTYQSKSYDCYKFISFRIQAGQLVSIFP